MKQIADEGLLFIRKAGEAAKRLLLQAVPGAIQAILGVPEFALLRAHLRPAFQPRRRAREDGFRLQGGFGALGAGGGRLREEHAQVQAMNPGQLLQSRFRIHGKGQVQDAQGGPLRQAAPGIQREERRRTGRGGDEGVEAFRIALQVGEGDHAVEAQLFGELLGLRGGPVREGHLEPTLRKASGKVLAHGPDAHDDDGRAFGKGFGQMLQRGGRDADAAIGHAESRAKALAFPDGVLQGGLGFFAR